MAALTSWRLSYRGLASGCMDRLVPVLALIVVDVIGLVPGRLEHPRRFRARSRAHGLQFRDAHDAQPPRFRGAKRHAACLPWVRAGDCQCGKIVAALVLPL